MAVTCVEIYVLHHGCVERHVIGYVGVPSV